jgi:3-methyladenine DNA glycosylase AlkC
LFLVACGHPAGAAKADPEQGVPGPAADELIGAAAVQALIATIERVRPSSQLAQLRASRNALRPLSLRARSDLLRDALLADLPGSYQDLDAVFRAALNDATFCGWLIWPVTEAITTKALQDGRDSVFDSALNMLAALTPRLTSEFAIRAFLEHDLDRALKTVTTWTGSPDASVRRLASEGTRPFLPWAKRVQAILKHPESTIPILDSLYRDESEFVRRSVANHLNDLSRQQPKLAVATATRWREHSDPNTHWVVRHGLRTLVKKGHPGALALLGFAPAHDIIVDGPTLGRRSVPIGEELPFSATLANSADSPATLAIDYIVHHLKANGSQTAKVFKLATRTIGPGESITLHRRHSFKLITRDRPGRLHDTPPAAQP